MKKMLRRELLREIRKSLNRYLSIFFIVMLGVAFFTGVRASEPDMRQSMDEMADRCDFMDFRVLCSYGLTEEDLAAVRAVPGVGTAEGEYFADVLEKSGEQQNVLHVMSLTDNLNKLTVKDGRMPEKTGECLIDEQLLIVSGYRIGSVLHFASGTETPLSDTMCVENFTVVGTCTSPYYLNFERGSSAIGNGDVKGYVFVPKDAFSMEVYTQIYVASPELKELLYTSDAYDTRAEELSAAIDEIVPERSAVRMEELTGDFRRQLEEGRAEYEKGRAEADQAFAEAEEKLADGEAQLSAGEAELEENRKKLAQAEKTIETNEASLEEMKKDLAEREAEVNGKAAAIAGTEAAYQAARNAWVQAKSARDTKNRELRSKEFEIRITESFPDSENKEALLERQRGELDVLTQELAVLEAVLAMHPQPDSSVMMSIFGEKIALNVERSALASTRKQVTDGEAQLTAGKEEYEEGLQAFKDAEKLLKEKRKEYENGLKTFEKEKAETEKKLNDALTEIEDGEAELAKVKEPEWYILGRDTVASYVQLSGDASKIGALGKVFPAIFFLVAALVSLTTMTRMVEERRTEIGTLLALGYSTAAISGKFILYALSATLTGSISGVFLGEKILPYVIIRTYKILYTNLQGMAIPYRASYGITATLIASLCTVGAAYFSCSRAVRRMPASLMRPAAPKMGKKILLERVRPLWKVLSFSQKSALRNLFRYKKRLLMTIFGIGACMALLIVGFGLRDSIYVVADAQFGDLWRYDGSLTISQDAEEEDKELLLASMREDEGVGWMLPAEAKVTTAVKNKKEISANVVIPSDLEAFHTLFSLRDRRTQEPRVLTDEGALITEKLSKQLGVGVGDTIRLKEDDFKSYSVNISGIVENYVYQYVYLTPAYYESVTGRELQYNIVYFTVSEKAGWSSEAEKLLNEKAVSGVSDAMGLSRTIRDMLSSLNLVIFVLILSAGLLAFVVLYNLNNINITERVRELATLKVLGYYDIETAAYVYRENVLLTILGIAAGIIMGKLLHSFTIQTVEVDVIMFGRLIKPSSYLWCILITFLFALIVNFVMFFRLRKIDMVESLKSVE